MGKSAGLDGWAAAEVNSFNDEMFQTLAAVYNKCEHKGQAPAAWKTMRQVHLSKDKPLQADGATLSSTGVGCLHHLENLCQGSFPA